MLIHNIGDEIELERGDFIYTLRVSKTADLSDVLEDDDCSFIPFNPTFHNKCDGCFFFNSENKKCTMSKEEFNQVGNCEWCITDACIDSFYDREDFFTDKEYGKTANSYSALGGYIFALVKKRPKEQPFFKELRTFLKLHIVKMFTKS